MDDKTNASLRNVQTVRTPKESPYPAKGTSTPIDAICGIMNCGKTNCNSALKNMAKI